MTEEEIHAWITFSTVPDMGLEDAVRLLGALTNGIICVIARTVGLDIILCQAISVKLTA